MNDSQNEKNNINKRPVHGIRRTISDVECIILGTIIGGAFLIAGIMAIFKNFLLGLLSISISVFPICEIFRGIISLQNKALINDPIYNQSEEKKNQAMTNDNRLKKISTIKKIGVVSSILILIIAILMGM